LIFWLIGLLLGQRLLPAEVAAIEAAEQQ